MEFNCSNCPQKDNASYPSIVISIIDEFNGIVYGKFCSYDCASKDTTSYFTAAAIGDYDSIVSTQIPSHYIKQVPVMKPTDVEAITWEVDMIRFLLNPNKFIKENSEPSSRDILLNNSLFSHIEDLNKLWNNLKENSEKILQCALLLYWITCQNGINKDIKNVEDLEYINHNAWIEYLNGYRFTNNRVNNGIDSIHISYNGSKFIVVENGELGTSTYEVEENDVVFQQVKDQVTT